MTITRPIKLLLVSLVGGLAVPLALGGAGCTSYPSPPSKPAFDTDVLPIFEAHCTRCHGNGPDGGALNRAVAPNFPYPDGGPNPTAAPFLTIFGSAARYALELPMYLNPDYTQRMPPPPAPLLNDWELKVVLAWSKNPICSNSSDPDPTICPAP
jgi:hypothetical protein